MKTWEKILLYPVGLYFWLGDRAKTAGKFMGRKVKPAVAMLVAVTMLLSLMPLTAFAESVPSGYTTDENGIMAYAYLLSGNFDIRGYFDGEWKSTTFGNRGYYTYLKQGGYTQSVSASSSANGGFTRDNLNISIDLAFTNEGQTMQILYTVKNIGSQTENFSLGTGADIQIGDDDCAVITPFDDGSGYKMVSDDADDYDSDNDEYAQFNFFATGYKGVTDVSDYWYGAYFSSSSSTGAYWTENKEAAVFCGNDVSESGTFDSAASWHWANQTLSAGETATYSVLIGIGGADSEDAAESSTHKHCVCGGTGAAGDHTSCEDITWTEWDGTGTFPGGNVYLTDDITLTEALTISGTVNLCLNGHKVSAEGGYFDVSGTLNLCSCKDNGIIKRTTTTNALISADAGATANLYNVTLDGGAVWEGTTDTVLKRGTTNSGITSSAPLIYAGGQRTAGGHITLNSGVILQNNECSDAGDGGAITLGEDGTLVINGATICNNAKTGGNAGAIKAYAGAQITLNSGEIYGNEAYKHGGAIQIFGGDSTDYADAVLTMNGSTIRNNKADGVGGGVAVSDYSSFTMNGGTIKDNATTDYSKRGGGVGFGDKNTAMSISGNAVISGNVAGINANNLYIGNNDCNKLSVETMGGNADVGVTMSSPGVFTNGGASYADKEYFTSDKPAYIVAADGNNLKLTIPHTHSYTYAVNGENAAQVIESCTCGHSETATLQLDANATLKYTGSAITPITVTYSDGWVGEKKTNADIVYAGNVNVGTATGTLTVDSASAEITFVITPASVPAVTFPSAVNSITYGQALKDAGLTFTSNAYGTFNWVDPNGVPNAGTAHYAVDFTPNAQAMLNYDWASDSRWIPSRNTLCVAVAVVVNKVDPGYTAPTAEELVYNGSTQTLVNAGSATTGTMQYALGSATEPTGSWSTTLPQGQNAGTYYVWYKVVGDENHNDVAPACVAVTIAKKQIAKPAADNSTFTYNGNYQTYAMNGDPAFIIENNVQKNAGSYTVTVTLQDTANYEWTDGTTAVLEYTFKIEQKEIGISWSNTALTYNGAAQRPTATATGVVTGEQIALLLSAPETNAGSYTAMVQGIDGETAQNYKLPAGRSTTFTIEQQALTIVWGNSNFTYDGAEKFPAFNVEGIWNADDVQVTKEGAQTNAGEYTAEISGLTGTAADNYKLTGTLAKAFVINKAEQAAPTGLSKTDETISKKADGTISGISSNMEYRKEGEATYEAVNSTVLENLVAGKYYVRYAADNNHNVSSDAEITIGAGRKLTVTVPQNQIGYTLITTTPELDYYGSIRVEFKLLPGYSMTENFEIYNGTEPIWQHFNQQTGILELTFVASDFDLTVAGVADISAPVAEIDIKNNKWTNFWNDITFGLFFNETQDVTIIASDLGSDVNTIQYYLAGDELELDEVKQITDWQDYNGTFKIDPNNRYIVYAKVTDNTGNILYINSDGIVLDNIAPTLEGIENGKTYYGDLTVIKSDEQFYDIKVVTLDGEEMGFAEGTYGLIPADNAEHIVVVEDHAGNKTTYTVTVMKNYTVTYKADGESVSTETVGHGKDASLPAVPAKEGFVGKWDADGKNITNDTTISVVYTAIPAVKPDEVKPENKSALEDAKAKLEEMLEDDSYTDNDKKDIQDAIDDIDDALEVIGNVEAVEDLIDKLPENITKNDEDAIKAADDACNALSDYEKSLVDEDAKKALDDAKAALAELNKPADTDSPQTGDNSNMFLGIALLFISGGAVITLTVVDRKRRMAN